MTAEREKRATIAKSEGERRSTIDHSEGDRQEAILRSEGEKEKRINEAKGKAQEILAVARATGEGLKIIADQINAPGGQAAAKLRVAEQYVTQFGRLAKESNTLVIPSSVGDAAGMVITAISALDKMKTEPGTR